MLIHFLTKSSVCYFHRLCRGNIPNFHESKQRQFEGCYHKAAREAPAPMNTMLEKQPRVEALQKRAEKSKMVTKDVPPTTPGIKEFNDATNCPLLTGLTNRYPPGYRKRM